MKRLLATAMILATATAIAFAQSVSYPEILLVGSWNIEDIQTGSGQKAQIMADHLRLLRLDILALNHIDGDAGSRNRQLEAIFEIANEEEGASWEYRLFPNGTSTDKAEMVGLAWNSERVSIESDVFRTVGDSRASWTKTPHAAKFSAGSGRTDIVVIPVQLAPQSRESDCLAGARGQQASELPGLIENARTHFSDDDIVVIGDTECIRDDTEALTAFETERSLDLRVGDVASFARGQSAYNRVMVPTGQPEFRSTRTYTVAEAEGRSREPVMSDHFVLLGPIRVQADDD